MYLNHMATAGGYATGRLRLTWDVFKYVNSRSNHGYNRRLRLTWDVFKWLKSN